MAYSDSSEKTSETGFFKNHPITGLLGGLLAGAIFAGPGYVFFWRSTMLKLWEDRPIGFFALNHVSALTGASILICAGLALIMASVSTFYMKKAHQCQYRPYSRETAQVQLGGALIGVALAMFLISSQAGAVPPKWQSTLAPLFSNLDAAWKVLGGGSFLIFAALGVTGLFERRSANNKESN